MFLNFQNHPNEVAKRKIKKELIKSLIYDRSMTKSETRKLMNKLKLIPVLSFTIASPTREYDSTKKIVEYLQPNDIFPFGFAMLFKEKNLHATLDCSDIVNYVLCEICSYDDSIEERNRHFKYEIEKFIDDVPIQKCSLLFTVQFFRNAIWFIEKKEVQVYCTEHRTIYNPDEFIAKHCSTQTVRDLVQGKLGSFCN